FASAKNVAVPALEYDSVKDELPVVIASLTDRATRDTVKFLKTIAGNLHGKNITLDLAKQEVERPSNGVIDPFRRFYRGSVDMNNWQTLHMVSSGPDEMMGTADDVAVDVWFGWVAWADPSTVDDKGTTFGGRGGGPFADAAGECGGGCGAPVPAPPPNQGHAQ